MIERGRWIAAALALATAWGAARADEKQADAGRLALVTEKVIVFKDGYGMVIRKGSARTDAQGRVFTDEVPDAAVLGSFWATPESGRLVSTHAGWVESTRRLERQADCAGTLEVLLANQGKLARVTLDDKAVHTGTIHRVLARRGRQPLAAEAGERLGLPAAGPGVRREIESASGSHFVLRTQDGDLMLPVARVGALAIDQMVLQWTRNVTETSKKKRLVFRFAEAGQQRTLWLVYFRPGLRWIPTYRVELEGGKQDARTARVVLQAELLNEAEPLAGTKVDLVVGVPNFRFKGLPSPLVLEQRLRRALVQAEPALMGQRNQMSNALYTQRSAEFRRTAVSRAAAGRAGVELPGELSADGKQDLYVYHLPPLDLKKGERCALPIFDVKVPYRDLYTWDVHFKQPGREGHASGSPLALSRNQTWHQVLLANATRQPWTTGAAMLLIGQQPLAQELLAYTSPKDEARVPVTVAVDVRGTYREVETGRKLDALRYKNYRYARIARRGTLNLCNHKEVPIEVEVTCRFGGKADDASHQGRITLGGFDRADWLSYYVHEGVNNHSEVRWTRSLKPGEVVDLTVDYHYFVRY